MEIDQILARIEKCKETIAKKENTIAKKEKLIEKKRAKDPSDYDIDYLRSDIERLHREIREKNVTLSGYYEQLRVETEKASQLEMMPTPFKVLHEETVKVWDAHDKHLKDDYDRAYAEYNKAMEIADEKVKSGEIKNRWSYKYDEIVRPAKTYYERCYEMRWKSDEEIHDANVKAGNKLILDLYDRVVEITGEITDGSGLHIDRNNEGFCIINGRAIGNKGVAKVQSIGAGGYNIQRWHIRVLVHKVKD